MTLPPLRPELTAATARALLELEPPRTELVRLALKELVMRGSWRLELRPSRLRRRDVPHLVPGHARRDLPAPLPLVDAALRADVPPAGRPARGVMQGLLRRHRVLAAGVERAAYGALVERGFVEERRTTSLRVVPRTVRARTPAGEALAIELKLALGRRDPDELGMLALLLVPDAVADLREADRRLRRGEAEAAWRTHDDEDLGAFDDVLSGNFDAVFDGGGGGGGGDGGGGGG